MPLIAVILDSTPLGLVTQKPGRLVEGDTCRTWMENLLVSGVKVYVPEVADYEVRRELIRIGQTGSIVTADRHALDGDVIVAAQALSLNLPPSEFVVATNNVKHLSPFVPVEVWINIKP